MATPTVPISPAAERDESSIAHNYIALLESTEAARPQAATSVSAPLVHSTTNSSSPTAAHRASKYADPLDPMYGATLSNALPDVRKLDTPRDVRELRETFRSGATRDLRMRRELLLQLQRLMKDGEAAIKEAMWKDLHKHPVESYLCEIGLLHQEIQEHLDYMDDWTKPQLVMTGVTNLPGLSYICREPLGVVCIIGTWNYPINLLFTPLIAAITAGNCAVLRLPGDDTTRYLNNVLISLLDKYMDKRFVRYVYGGVDETKAMLRERYDLIFATGGCFLGKIVARAAAEHLTPTVLELGGKSPCIVDDSTDIALAARRATWGAFTNAGQTCVRPDYVLVDERIGDKFVAALEKQIAQFYGKDVQQCEGYGRIVNERSYQRLTKLLKADQARVTFGGAMDDKENFLAPTLFNFKTDLQGFTSSAVMSEELFGPLLPIYYYPAGQLQWAIDFVSSREKPLALYLYSTSSTNKKKVVKETSSGSLVINDCMMQLANGHLPFGGVGNSGMGSYHGRHGVEAFSHKKAVMYKYSFLDLAQRYMPYSAGSERVLRILMYPFSRKQLRVLKLLFFVAVVAAIGVGIKGAIDK